MGLNLRKCVLVASGARTELSRFAHLTEASLVDIRDEHQGFEVIGVPMDRSVSVQKALEETTGKVERFCEQLVDLEHPQMGFILLRQCCGTCRVIHLLRAMDNKHTARLVEAVDNSVMEAALAMLRAPCAENARTQLTLPLLFGGCGLARASDIAPLAAFTGRWSFHDQGYQLVHFPSALISEPPEALLPFLKDAVQTLPAQFLLPRVWLAEERLPAKMEADWLKLDYWREKIVSLSVGEPPFTMFRQRVGPAAGAWFLWNCLFPMYFIV